MFTLSERPFIFYRGMMYSSPPRLFALMCVVLASFSGAWPSAAQYSTSASISGEAGDFLDVLRNNLIVQDIIVKRNASSKDIRRYSAYYGDRVAFRLKGYIKSNKAEKTSYIAVSVCYFLYCHISCVLLTVCIVENGNNIIMAVI